MLMLYAVHVYLCARARLSVFAMTVHRGLQSSTRIICYDRWPFYFPRVTGAALVIQGMWRPLYNVIVGVVILSATGRSNAAFLRSKTGAPNGVIVQLFEWRFDDIAKECEDFLGPAGYAGVQVSPVSENVVLPNRPWLERYQPVSYKIVTKSGDENAFRDMVARCNKAGVKIYVDVILNHMTRNLAKVSQGSGGSKAETTAFKYPAVPYAPEDFHRPPCQITNWQNAKNVRDCELLGLHDLDQSKASVRQNMRNFLNKLISIGVAGFRVDSAKHMWPDHLKLIFSRLRYLNSSHGFACESEPFIYLHFAGKASDGELDATQYYPLGLVTDYKYGYEVSRAFRGLNGLKWYETLGKGWGLLDSDKAFIFINDHNTERGDGFGEFLILNHGLPKQYKMAIAFMLAFPYGQPSILSSYYFTSKDQGPPTSDDGSTTARVQFIGDACTNGWSCEHRWRQIYNMVKFRNVVGDEPLTKWWFNGDYQVAFSRGNKGFIAFNAADAVLNAKIETGLPDGTYCDIIHGNLVKGVCTGNKVEVHNGHADIMKGNWEEDGVVAIHVDAKQV